MMAILQHHPSYCSAKNKPCITPSNSSSPPPSLVSFRPSSSSSSCISALLLLRRHRPWPAPKSSSRSRLVVRSSSTSGSVPSSSSAPSLSDVLWPSAGAFAAMALLGRLDQAMAPRGLSFTVAPLGAVCAVLFATPTSPAAQKYNMFVAQIGCAAFGVLALAVLGPGWLARAASLAASIAFMILTRSVHPPAASLPIMFIDGAKFHSLNFWYALFPGATGCLLLCLIQEIVTYLKNNYKF